MGSGGAMPGIAGMPGAAAGGGTAGGGANSDRMSAIGSARRGLGALDRLARRVLHRVLDDLDLRVGREHGKGVVAQIVVGLALFLFLLFPVPMTDPALPRQPLLPTALLP